MENIMTTYTLLKLLTGTSEDGLIAKEFIDKNPECLVELTQIAHYAGASIKTIEPFEEFGGGAKIYDTIWRIYPAEEAEKKLVKILMKIKKDHAREKQLQGKIW